MKENKKMDFETYVDFDCIICKYEGKITKVRMTFKEAMNGKAAICEKHVLRRQRGKGGRPNGTK